jgi:predicted DsbA family dithiol-disulfide isomerase
MAAQEIKRRTFGRTTFGSPRLKAAPLSTYLACEKRRSRDMPDQTEPLSIVVVSDVVCPWCFIGKRRLEKAIALRPEIPVAVQWHPYFLNDWIPREGISREQYLTTKFGSVERYAGIAQRVAEAAAQEGLVYAMDKISRQPNTLDCHRLIGWAQEAGDGAGMKQRLMDLYFTEGGDLTDREVLVRAAADCGLDPDETRQRLGGDLDVAAVEQAAAAAKQAGIDGVPCFIFGGVLAVSGAQAPEYLADALSRASSERKRRIEETSAGA